MKGRKVHIVPLPGAGVYELGDDGIYVALGEPLPFGPITKVRYLALGGWFPFGTGPESAAS